MRTRLLLVLLLVLAAIGCGGLSFVSIKGDGNIAQHVEAREVGLGMGGAGAKAEATAHAGTEPDASTGGIK